MAQNILKPQMSVRCLPRGMCSWNYVLKGDDHGSMKMRTLTETGTITACGKVYEVRKTGPLKGEWSLVLNGDTIASAQKLTVFTRSFEIQSQTGTLQLNPDSAFKRSFWVEESGDLIATIKADHGLTRRATIEGFDDEWDFSTISFAFWLVVLMWRRAQNSGG